MIRSIKRRPLPQKTMFTLNASNTFYLCCESTDLRKGFNTLVGNIQNRSCLNPLDGSVYIFLNRARNTLKLLQWERDGFVIYHKRLEAGYICKTIFEGEFLYREIRWDELISYFECAYSRVSRRSIVIDNIY